MKRAGLVLITRELLAQRLNLPDGVEVVGVLQEGEHLRSDTFIFKMQCPADQSTFPIVREGEIIPIVDLPQNG